MSNASQGGTRFVAPLAQRVGDGAGALDIARAMSAIWRDIGSALAPILGERGVAALYRRCVALTAVRHPWLQDVQTDALPPDLSQLEAVFAPRTSAEAAAAGNAFLQTFYELLTSLVGDSLTARLLRSVWNDGPGGSPAQDKTP